MFIPFFYAWFEPTLLTISPSACLKHIRPELDIELEPLLDILPESQGKYKSLASVLAFTTRFPALVSVELRFILRSKALSLGVYVDGVKSAMEEQLGSKIFVTSLDEDSVCCVT
ncbi:hypothetical protein DXG03_002129 [Asterophora parasitica]|uniref:Uncharacterized protein n=1 Tax=Asterophora parasitica TaxID=117018 RepID=A0A9P7G4M8_9AGAR|nr:hypothetical protein DXG03_002129 [Asterophora parasitica]